MTKRLLIAIAAAAAVMLSATPAMASMVHVWSCNMNEGKTPADVQKVSSDWIKAAKSMEGGTDLELYLNFPIAAEAADGEFMFVLIVPDGKTWGTFMDGYEGSAASRADAAWSAVAGCSKSSLWGSVKIE